jgi:putative addiction module component (TIGR02574 family)
MVLDTLPAVKALSDEQKSILTQELLDELNAPQVSDECELALLEMLNARYEAYSMDPSTASSWEAVKERLRQKTGASWQR